MSTIPKISVILPTYNRPKLLSNALESLATQTFQDFEVVIVNDGGEMSTEKVISKWEHHLNIVPIKLETNSGLPAARNVGIKMSRCSILAFLDDDDIFLPNHLSTGFHALQEGQFELVYFDCVVKDNRVTPGTQFLNLKNTQSFDYTFDPDFLMICNYIPIISLMCRNLRDSNIQFDESLKVQEDWDMLLQMYYVHNYKFRHLPITTSVYHRIPGFASSTCQAANLQIFKETYNKLVQKWSIYDHAKIQTGRYYINLYYHLCTEALSQGKLIPHYGYEKCIRIVKLALKQEISSATVVQLIREIFQCVVI
jgi:glycosyltransferase involved in cell wall biosynthesis